MRPLKRSSALPVVLFAFGLGLARTAAADALSPGVAATNLTLTTPVTGLTAPTALSFLPDGRLVVTEKAGQVWLFNGDGTGKKSIGMFDVDTESEKGLLNVLVPPDFATSKHLIFYYSASNNAGGTDLDRHRVSSVGMGTDDTLDIANEKVLLQGLRGPANHDGGGLTLSPDGKYLYVSVGDTGCNSNAPPVNPQTMMANTPTNYFGTCLTNANGKVLRINLDGTIPTDNPLSNVAMVTACGTTCNVAPTAGNLAAPRKEIWAWGFRNPFRVWADPKTGFLWVGHVGEVTFEAINVVTNPGQDFGWPWREGEFGYPINQCATITPHDNTPMTGGNGDCVNPVYYYAHNGVNALFQSHPNGGGPIDGDGVAVIGGLIVDSCTWPAAVSNLYYFGDEGTSHIWALAVNSARTGVTGPRIDIATGAGVTDFEVGPDKALYYTTIGGNVGRLAPKTPVMCTDGAGGTSGAGGAATAGASGSGTSGSGAGTSGEAGATNGTAGATGAPAASKDSGGCGCRIAGARETRGLALLGAAVGLVTLRRRRRLGGRAGTTN